MVNDRYLTGEDYEFAKLVYDDIEKFVNCPGEKRALLFPAVNSRRRFLIHHTVADYFPNLASLSVGEGEQRRTAVTLKQQLEQHQLLQEKHRREEQLLREDEERERQRERQQQQEATVTQRSRNVQQEQQQQRRECSQESNNTIDRKQRNRQQQQYRNSPEIQDSDASSRQQERGKNRNNKENADGEERREPEKKEGRRRNRKRDKRGSSSALSLQQKEQEEQQGNNRNRRQHQQQQEQDDTRLKQNQHQQSKNPRSGENFGGNPIRKSASSSAVLCPTEDGEGGCSSSEQPERKASKRRRRDTKKRNRNNNEKNRKDGEEEVEEYEDRKGSRAQSRESFAKPKENTKSQHQEHLEVSSVNGEWHSECHTSKGRKRGSRRSPSKSVPVPPESNGSEQYNADGELAPLSRANTTAPSAPSAGRKVKRSASNVSSASNCECDPRRDGPERRDQRSTPERSKALSSWRTGEGVASSPSPSSSSNASSRRGSSTQTADRSRDEQFLNHHHPPNHHHHHHHHSQHQSQSYRRSSIGPVAPETTTPTTSCNSYSCDWSPSCSKSYNNSSGCGMPVNMTADIEINNKVKRGKGVSAAIYRPPPARRDGPLHPSSRVRLDSQGDIIQTSTPTSSVSRPRAKRPDQQLYVPKGRRYGPHDAPTPDMEPRPPSPAYSVASESSGRNRYNNRSQQGSHLSIYDEDLDEHNGAPLHNDLRDLSRESTPAYGNNKGNSGAGLFSKQTLQLIERCMNQDRQDSWENSSVNSSPSPKNNRRYTNGGANVCKSPTPKRDLDSVHSKENVLLPNDQVPTRTRKNRRNRRRGSRSRDQLNDQSNKDQLSRTPQRNTSNNPPPSSSEWVFYNSSYDYNNDRYDNRGYDNYDRYSSSRNNSKASSRNSSRERQQQYQQHQQSNSSHYPHLDWRNRGNNVNTSYSIPSSPAKGYTHPGYQHSRNSAKPPSGRLGSLPNVALDFGETRRRSLTEQTVNNVSPKNTSPRAPKSIEESSSMSPHSYVQPSRTPCSSLNTSCSSNSSPHIVPDTHEHFTPVMSDISERVEPLSANQDQTSSNSQTVDSNTQLISSQEHEASPSIEPVVPTSNQNGHMDTDSCSPNDSSHTRGHTPTERVEEVNHQQTEQHTIGSVNSDSAEEEESKPEEVQKVQKEGTKEEEEKPAEEETSPPKEGLKKNPKKFSFNWADEVEDSWDSMYDESGECLDPELKKQLDNTVGKVTFEEPEHDYYNYQAKDSSPVLINDAEYSHVIEIYDFPVSFKTQDLLSIFGSFQNTGFDIKWVDDTHALGVFTTALIASEALNIDHPFIKTRPLTLATRASKAKALRITEALLPYKPRPETSAALARRLVSGALGLKVNVSREVREAEKQKLKDAKAKKRLAAKQREDAWEGTIV